MTSKIKLGLPKKLLKLSLSKSILGDLLDAKNVGKNLIRDTLVLKKIKNKALFTLLLKWLKVIIEGYYFF